MWGDVPKDPFPFNQVLRISLPEGEIIGKNQPSCLLFFSLPLPIPVFHLKLGLGTLSNHPVPSACILSTLLSLEIALGREAPGESGENGSFIFPLPDFQSLSWAKSPSAPSLLLMPFNSESAGATGIFIREGQLDLSYGKTGAKHAVLLQAETSEISVKPEQSSPGDLV